MEAWSAVCHHLQRMVLPPVDKGMPWAVVQGSCPMAGQLGHSLGSRSAGGPLPNSAVQEPGGAGAQVCSRRCRAGGRPSHAHSHLPGYQVCSWLLLLWTTGFRVGGWALADTHTLDPCPC